MKLHLKPAHLPILTAGLGFAAMILRFMLYAVAVDEKGLLIRNHPLAIGLWLLGAAAALIILLCVRTLKGTRRHSANFPVSLPATGGCWLFAAGILVTVVMSRNDISRLALLRNLAGLVAVPSLAAVGICRQRGRRPYALFHVVVCIYLTLYTVSHYPGWSSMPQLQDCFFAMISCILLMLFAYHQAAFDAGMGSRRMQLGTGLLAGFTCFAAIAGNPELLLHLTAGIWALTNLCSLNLTRCEEDASPQ